MTRLGNWRDWQVPGLVAVIAGLFVLDLQAPREVPLLPYFWLPVLLAMAFATPAQVMLLNLVAFGFSIASGIHFRYYVEPDYWARLLFLGGVSLLALRFTRQRTRLLNQLTTNQEHYRLLAENASDVVFRVDLEGRLEWISRSIQPLLGWTPAEVIGESILSLIHPDDADAVRQRWAICNSTNATRMQYRILNRNGEIRWVSVSCRTVSDSKGQLVGRIGSWSDAHDQILARERLVDQQELLETILDNVDSHIYMKDAEHRYVYANRQVQRLYGRSLQEIVGRTDRDFFSGEVLEKMWAFDEEVFSSGRELQREEPVTNDQGELRWFLSNKLVLRQDDQNCLIGFSTDITERRSAEEQLKRSERQFRLLFEASLDAILLVSPQGQIIDANPAVLQIYGVTSKEDLLQATPHDFSPEFQNGGERSEDLIKSNISRALEQGSHQFEWIHRRFDTGEPFIGLVTLKAITLNGEPALLSVVRDISEAKRYEEQLRQTAYCDSLTTLPNRAATIEQLEQLLAAIDGCSDQDQATQPDPSRVDPTNAEGLVLVNLDFDRFQAVNDSFGLQVGDRLLTVAAQLLRDWLQPGDWLARLESDEFLVIRRVPVLDPVGAFQFGRNLQQAVADGLASHGDLPIHPPVSAGISLCPTHGCEAITLMQAANTALMEAKRQGPSASAPITQS